MRNHECGFCEQTFESLKYLQIHLNICNNPKVNKYGPKSQHGKRKREDSRQSIPPIGNIEVYSFNWKKKSSEITPINSAFLQ